MRLLSPCIQINILLTNNLSPCQYFGFNVNLWVNIQIHTIYLSLSSFINSRTFYNPFFLNLLKHPYKSYSLTFTSQIKKKILKDRKLCIHQIISLSFTHKDTYLIQQLTKRFCFFSFRDTIVRSTCSPP